MVENKGDTPIDLTPLQAGFTLINEEEIGVYLEENRGYVETLIRAQKVVREYFPHIPFSLYLDTPNSLGYRPFILAIHPRKCVPSLSLVEGFQRLNYLYQEWGTGPLESAILIGFSPYSMREHKEQMEEQLYAHTT